MSSSFRRSETRALTDAERQHLTVLHAAGAIDAAHALPLKFLQRLGAKLNPPLDVRAIAFGQLRQRDLVLRVVVQKRAAKMRTHYCLTARGRAALEAAGDEGAPPAEVRKIA